MAWFRRKKKDAKPAPVDQAPAPEVKSASSHVFDGILGEILWLSFDSAGRLLVSVREAGSDSSYRAVVDDAVARKIHGIFAERFGPAMANEALKEMVSALTDATWGDGALTDAAWPSVVSTIRALVKHNKCQADDIKAMKEDQVHTRAALLVLDNTLRDIAMLVEKGYCTGNADSLAAVRDAVRKLKNAEIKGKEDAPKVAALTAEVEGLRREVKDLTRENDRLTGENNSLKTELASARQEWIRVTKVLAGDR